MRTDRLDGSAVPRCCRGWEMECECVARGVARAQADESHALAVATHGVRVSVLGGLASGFAMGAVAVYPAGEHAVP